MLFFFLETSLSLSTSSHFLTLLRFCHLHHNPLFSTLHPCLIFVLLFSHLYLLTSFLLLSLHHPILLQLRLPLFLHLFPFLPIFLLLLQHLPLLLLHLFLIIPHLLYPFPDLFNIKSHPSISKITFAIRLCSLTPSQTRTSSRTNNQVKLIL